MYIENEPISAYSFVTLSTTDVYDGVKATLLTNDTDVWKFTIAQPFQGELVVSGMPLQLWNGFQVTPTNPSTLNVGSNQVSLSVGDYVIRAGNIQCPECPYTGQNTAYEFNLVTTSPVPEADPAMMFAMAIPIVTLAASLKAKKKFRSFFSTKK